MADVKVDKAVLFASFPKMFSHLIKPIKEEQARPISVSDYFSHIQKTKGKRYFKKYLKYHELIRKFPDETWILSLEGISHVDGEETDGHIFVFQGELREVASTDILGIFEAAGEDDDDDDSPDDDDDDSDDDSLFCSYKTCFNANTSNGTCASTTSFKPANGICPGDSCSTDEECSSGSADGLMPWDKEPVTILTAGDW